MLSLSKVETVACNTLSYSRGRIAVGRLNSSFAEKSVEGSPMSNEVYSPEQQALIDVWDRHTAAEFLDKDALEMLRSAKSRKVIS